MDKVLRNCFHFGELNLMDFYHETFIFVVYKTCCIISDIFPPFSLFLCRFLIDWVITNEWWMNGWSVNMKIIRKVHQIYTYFGQNLWLTLFLASWSDVIKRDVSKSAFSLLGWWENFFRHENLNYLFFLPC